MAVPENITGSGSQSDPYMVGNWQDLVNVAGSSTLVNTYIKFKDSVVEDLSASYKNSLKTPTANFSGSITAIHVDFNGAIITNGDFTDVLYRAKSMSSSASAYTAFYINNLVMLNCKISSCFATGAGSSDHLGMEISDSVLDIYTESSTKLFIGSFYSKAYRNIYRSRLTFHGEGSIGNGVTFQDSVVELDIVATTPVDTFAYRVTTDGELITSANGLLVNQYLAETRNDSSYPLNTSNLNFVNSYITGRLRVPSGETNKKTAFLCAAERSIFEINCDYLLLYYSVNNTLNNGERSIAPLYFEGSYKNNVDSMNSSPQSVFSKTTLELRNPVTLYDMGYSIDPNNVAT